MKTYKRIISLVVVFAMVMSLCIVQSPTKSFAGVKIIVGKKLDFTINSKETILVKGKAKAKSANKKIARITKVKKKKKKTTITVQGKKVGKTKIKIKVGKKSKKVKVTIRPKTVTGLKVALSGDTAARLNWSKAKGANGYYIYRSATKNGKYTKIATVKTNTYTNSGLELGKFYYYKIMAYGNKNIQSEEFSAIKYVRTWKLIWSDEFNGTALDTTKWNNEGATGDDGFGNNELQDYEMEYCEVKDGKLVIKPTIHWNRTTNYIDEYYDEEGKKHLKCYSTKLWTKGQHSWTYGKFEFRAKMPKGVGTWAAGWALGESGGWPLCGEIDVFETTSQKAKTFIPQSLHTKKFNGMKTSSGNKHYDSIISTATSAYHNYQVEWFPTYIRFRIDGKETGIYDPSNYVLEGDGTDDITIWPYKQPFYLIMNCAIGGTLGGKVEPTYWKKIGSEGNNDIYQDYLYFDHVKVFK